MRRRFGDAYGYRVVAFDETGKQAREFGKKGQGPGAFDVSAGITLRPENRLMVADFMNLRQIWLIANLCQNNG